MFSGTFGQPVEINGTNFDSERAKALRDRILLAVKFDSDAPVVAQLDAIQTLTDEAIAELELWYG